MKKLRLLPPVTDDITQAVDRYDAEGYAGLGDRFLAVFYASLPQIQHHGDTATFYRPIYKDFRRVLLEPFSLTLL